MHTGRLNFMHRSWGQVEPFANSLPAIKRFRAPDRGTGQCVKSGASAVFQAIRRLAAFAWRAPADLADKDIQRLTTGVADVRVFDDAGDRIER